MTFIAFSRICVVSSNDDQAGAISTTLQEFFGGCHETHYVVAGNAIRREPLESKRPNPNNQAHMQGGSQKRQDLRAACHCVYFAL
jgi:hypothetical protein